MTVSEFLSIISNDGCCTGNEKFCTTALLRVSCSFDSYFARVKTVIQKGLGCCQTRVVMPLLKNKLSFLLQLLSRLKFSHASSDNIMNSFYGTIIKRSKIVSKHIHHWMTGLHPIKGAHFVISLIKLITSAMHTDFFMGWPITSSMMPL